MNSTALQPLTAPKGTKWVPVILNPSEREVWNHSESYDADYVKGKR